jgi:subtilisin family serine protease
MPRVTPSGPRRWRSIAAAISGVAIGAAGLGTALPAAAEPDTAASASASSTSAVDGVHSVTLITGDRVRVTEFADGTNAVDITSVDEGAGVQTIEADGETYVLPATAMPYLASGALDRDLFNVTKLIEYAYDDGSVDSTPLIVELEQGASGRRSAPVPGLDLGTELESIDAAAANATHADASATWSALTAASDTRARGAASTFGGGITAIHLDGKVSASLATSVPYIGASEAWAEGYTGTGVTVAVLDTGYDDTHLDLVGRVLSESTSFVPGEEVAWDPNGHGTHVASTVAGTGAASAGANRGVADGADLLIGKVLDKSGHGQDSWIIDAMEWAADRAPIVSMSLGSSGGDDGTNPMSLALDAISEETGALFVVAAGNEYDPETIGAPGSASRALTVGSIADPTGALSEFSSEGPLIRSGSLKPEIAAPGTNITAARSSDMAGTAVPYRTISGTSMATPHVAGAAAVLKQRHPEYTGAELRAALMSSATDVGLSPYSVGAGVVAVGAAVDATVVASGSGDFGTLAWGEEPEPVTRTIEYANQGDAEVVLDLVASLDDTTPGGAGGDVPADVLTSDAEQLAVPAGETRAVALTIDPSKVPTGLQYSGALVASIAGEPVATTPLGVIAESERYDLSMTATDFDGNPIDEVALLWDVDNKWFANIAVSDETTLRLPAGNYAVLSWLDVQREADVKATALVGDPDVVLDRDTTVALDARKAKPVTVDVGEDDLQSILRRMEYTFDGLRGTSMAALDVDELWAQPMEGPDGEKFAFATRWRLQHPKLQAETAKEGLDLTVQNGSAPLDGRLRTAAVDVGAGSSEEFAAVDVRGKVAVVTRSAEVASLVRAQNASEAGAAMVIVVNDADGEFIEHVKSGSASPVVDVPVASVSGVQGRRLLEAIADGKDKITIDGELDSSEIWDIVRYSDGAVPSDLGYRPKDLARIDTTYHGPRAPIAEFRYDFLPGVTSSLAQPFASNRGIERTEWVNTTKDVRWLQDVAEIASGWNIRDVLRTYEPRSTQSMGYFGPVVRPYVGQGYAAPSRSANSVSINVPGWADGGGADHTGGSVSVSAGSGRSQRTEIYVGDQLKASTSSSSASVSGLPETSARIRVVSTTSNDGVLVPSSTSTRSEWAFSTSAGSGRQLLPMLQAVYDVDSEVSGLVGAGRKKHESVPIGVEIGHLAGATGSGAVSGATLEVRLADGDWAPVDLEVVSADTSGPGAPATGSFATGRAYVTEFRSSLRVPDVGGWVDLRVTATDAMGNTFSQEITHAFEVGAAKGAHMGTDRR